MPVGNSSAKRSTASHPLDDSFQQLLLELSAADAAETNATALIRRFCRAASDYFQVSGVYYWEMTAGRELLPLEAYGAMAERFRASRLRLSDQALPVEAVRKRRVLYLNDLDPALHPLAVDYRARSLMAAPLLFGGEALGALGALAFLHETAPEHFNDDMAAKAAILAGQLSSLLELARHQAAVEEHRQRAEHLMGLALELGSALSLPEFVKSFTARAADMLGASAAVLALAHAAELETVFMHGAAEVTDKGILRRLNLALAEVNDGGAPVVEAAAADLVGPAAAALGWEQLVVARLSGSDGELLGCLCLANRTHRLTASERNLLQALAGHASVALENARLFSRITQSSRQWAEIFDAITDFIVVHDEGNKVLRVNRSLAESIGVPPAELIGVSMRALVAIAGEGGSRPCPLCRPGAEHADEYIHPVLDCTYMVSTSRIHGALNEGMQTIHVLKDITDRTEAERRYRELFDNVQEGVFFSTPEGRFIEVNDALVRLLGYASREELLQVDIPSELYLDPEDRSRWMRAMEEQGTVRNYEQGLRRKDGALIHTLHNSFAVRDALGRVVQYRGVLQDITSLKDFQAQLQRERDFNSKILNNTQSLILVADPAGRITFANRRCYEAGAYCEGELLGREVGELVSEPRREALIRALEATLQGQQVDNLELPLVRGEGKLGQFSVNLSPMRDEQGHVASIVVVMSDISDAALLQAKLMHTEKMAAVGQLVSGVAHEVNNPLTAILGFADLLLENPEMPANARRDLQVIMQEAQRTKLIVQNLLSFARQTPPQRHPVQLNLVLRRTLQLRSYDFANHGVDVVERYAEDLPDIVGDSQQLQQVFLNILNNAYDAVRESGRRGRIEVQTANGGGQVEVAFRNNGPAITHPERIFDPFFTTKEVGKGTGLGLSICYGIVHEHGGEISCRNLESGEGVVFTVRLPLSAPAGVAETAAQAHAAATAAKGGA